MTNQKRREPISVPALALRAELQAGTPERLATMGLDDMTFEVCSGRDSLWVVARAKDPGGLAIRAAHWPGGGGSARVIASSKPLETRLEIESPIGSFEVQICAERRERLLLRITSALTPAEDVLVTHLPRDLYPLGRGDDPIGARGRVEAAQRGLNTGLIYFRYDDGAFCDVLYVQNLSALNDYYRQTKTKPDGAVGGQWPELGYLPPTPPQSPVPPTNPLARGRRVTLSDALIVFSPEESPDERRSALKFLQMLATLYPHLGKPALTLHDWPARARKTVRDLQRSAKATIQHYGHTYVHPYTAAEYPDSMVQMTVLAALREWEAWTGEPSPLADEMARGLAKFYDAKLQAIRRYLPNVGDDKNADAVDSWYLYHPLLNLGHLALSGDKAAERLFLKSIDFAIKAAHHFQYIWPIQFDVKSFAVITEARNDDGLGQTDVGGLYAYVMAHAFELTGESRFLDEAKAAIRAAERMRFELEYQANLTAWGAAACVRLWRICDDPFFLDQSYVYLASFFHNTAMWESEIDGAAHYSNFLGASCLHDGPYMALYECFDSFCAFDRLLRDTGPEFDDAVRLLVTEYCRYALDRAWFYYPDALPKDLLATKSRNGHIDPRLSFPLEDLYIDGQPAGQVGQEIYGCGAALAFAVRAFHPVAGAPFLLFCDVFVARTERLGAQSLLLVLSGSGQGQALLIVLPQGRGQAPTITLCWGDKTIQPISSQALTFEAPADARLVLNWD